MTSNYWFEALGGMVERMTARGRTGVGRYDNAKLPRASGRTLRFARAPATTLFARVEAGRLFRLQATPTNRTRRTSITPTSGAAFPTMGHIRSTANNGPREWKSLRDCSAVTNRRRDHGNEFIPMPIAPSILRTAFPSSPKWVIHAVSRRSRERGRKRGYGGRYAGLFAPLARERGIGKPTL